MDRKAITGLLTKILIRSRLADRKYYAREVTLDYGTKHAKRVDVMQFTPKGVVHASNIEKGTFTCYEIKSCREDIYSGNGLNFFGEHNYLVMTMDTYKRFQQDIPDGHFNDFLAEHYPGSSTYWGVLVPVPIGIDLRDTKALYQEYSSPTPFGGNPEEWKLYTIISCREGPRTRSMTELLFCMLRSKQNDTNAEEK